MNNRLSVRDRKKRPVLFAIVLVILLAILSGLSLFLGSTDISWQTVLQALFDPDLTNHQQIAILELRLPRTIGDILCGACFAASGALMQGMTRNPLADSGLLGINSGASFALAICLAVMPSVTFGVTILFSFAGAAVSTILLYGILHISRRKIDPVRLVLAGSAISILFSSLAQGLALTAGVGQEVTFWTAGGTAGIRMSQLPWAAPVMLAALAGAIALTPACSLLALGQESARGLGLNVERSMVLILTDVLFLAGSATALAGPIAFAGLLVPHFVRYFIGGNYRLIIPFSMLAGAVFMVGADIIARMINAPAETPVGLIFAVIGVPAFIWIVRKGGSEFE